MNYPAAFFYLVCLSLWTVCLGILPNLTYLTPEHTRLTVFLGAFAGTVCLVIGIGIQVAGTPLGILQSGRNTYSLSRLQMALWTLVILSALIAAAVCRAWQLGPGTLSTALNIWIPQELFAVMGISYFSGAAAPAILSLKSQTPSTPDQISATTRRMGEPICVTGSVVHRPTNASPKLADIVQGDDVSTAGTVDLSKVQQLLITLLLVGVYFSMLANMFLHGLPSVTASAGNDHTERTMLPAFSQDFVTLLSISHASYLAYKAAPRPAIATPPSDSPFRPTPPDRTDLTV